MLAFQAFNLEESLIQPCIEGSEELRHKTQLITGNLWNWTEPMEGSERSRPKRHITKGSFWNWTEPFQAQKSRVQREKRERNDSESTSRS